MIKVLIADDEAPAREELIYMLKPYENIKIIGQASYGIEAIEKSKELHPDIIFLDINMPGIDGIEVAKEILKLDKMTKIVFVTAYDEYALKAFEVNAIDYILKPISDERFRKTIEKIFKNIEEKEKNTKDIEHILEMLKRSDKRDNPNRVSLYRNDKLIPIDLNDIIYATVQNRITRVWTKKGMFSTNNSLLELQQRLGSQFFRTHKSFLVNIYSIEEIQPWFNSTYNLKLNMTDEDIPVSRSQVRDFKTIMNID